MCILNSKISIKGKGEKGMRFSPTVERFIDALVERCEFWYKIPFVVALMVFATIPLLDFSPDIVKNVSLVVSLALLTFLGILKR